MNKTFNDMGTNRTGEDELQTIASAVPSCWSCCKLRLRLALRAWQARKSITRFLPLPSFSFVIRICACSSDNGFFFTIDLIASSNNRVRSVCIHVCMIVGWKKDYKQYALKQVRKHINTKILCCVINNKCYAKSGVEDNGVWKRKLRGNFRPLGAGSPSQLVSRRAFVWHSVLL